MQVFSLTRVAGPVAHWMQRCVFDSQSLTKVAWGFESSQVPFVSMACVSSSSSSSSSSFSSLFLFLFLFLFFSFYFFFFSFYFFFF
jgi:hypothetical protein